VDNSRLIAAESVNGKTYKIS